MKTATAIILVALALSPTISSAAEETRITTTATTSAANSVQAASSRVYVVSGSVSVTHGKNPAHRVTDNEIIASDTLINTGEKSSALLKFEDGQVVTMQANSTFHVREYRYDVKQIEKSNIVFSMLRGGMRFFTGLIGQQRKSAFRLYAPTATIGIRGTEFMVVMVDGSMYSQVLAGSIDMTNAAGTTVIGAGQSAAIASSNALVTLVSASAIPVGTFSELLSIPVSPSAIPALGSGAGKGISGFGSGTGMGVDGVSGSGSYTPGVPGSGSMFPPGRPPGSTGGY